MRATGLDHIVLNVADAARSLAWYRDRLGLVPERVAEREAGEALFPSVRIDPGTIIDLFELDRTGQNVDHVCLVVEDFDPDAAASSGEWDVHGGPSDVWGARGWARSLYVRDPDGNVVELRSYP